MPTEVASYRLDPSVGESESGMFRKRTSIERLDTAVSDFDVLAKELPVLLGEIRRAIAVARVEIAGTHRDVSDGLDRRSHAGES